MAFLSLSHKSCTSKWPTAPITTSTMTATIAPDATASSTLNILLYVHGFRGSGRSFARFPIDLERRLHQHGFVSHVFPRFDCRHQLGAATLGVCNYLRRLALGYNVDQADAAVASDAEAAAAVEDQQKQQQQQEGNDGSDMSMTEAMANIDLQADGVPTSRVPTAPAFSFPTADPSATTSRALHKVPAPIKTVRVVLIAHSMGGLVVADALRVLMDPTHSHHALGLDESILPLGVIALDTPYFSLSEDLLDMATAPASQALDFAQTLSAPLPWWAKAGLAVATAVGSMVVAARHGGQYREFLTPLLMESIDERVQRVQFMLDRGVPFKCYYPEVKRPGSTTRTFIFLPAELPEGVRACFTPIPTTLPNPVEAHVHIFDPQENPVHYGFLLADVTDDIRAWLDREPGLEQEQEPEEEALD
ncbi:hypothetical protein AMAG_03326 [Allomyces macrogynus ATCC 38327]|uniref:AB hydrolase-1 domain-containing protein n=1 Tax=Allomyces macrogynus (strain ATCC 38327) TaxID=578462 RepID=A0A0L0S9A4_ALLM3|nr:hypothetical protein AMAG_03326 [Allomyces macrogynus ATCC 38327]|eukprot:KNE58970.1 hypothetical protein AMAG_03326 [Allomyces macrogynus ATCC 38327]